MTSHLDRLVSVVIPSYNRARALEANLPHVLRMERVDEIVVVVDGSIDDTDEVLARFADPRLKVIRQSQQGAPAARNAGVAASSGRWLLVIDDDDVFPEDFGSRLLDVAERESADIVGAPWVDVGGEGLEEALRRARAVPVVTRDLSTHPRTFPAGTIETPFLSNTSLISRRVFDRVRFDGSYRGNAWREETSFFLSAVEAGFRVVLTDETYSYHLHRYSGGQRRGRLAYEYWLARNNWRFLRRHGRWLRDHGHVGRVPLAQLGFMGRRVVTIAAGRIAGLRQRP